MSRIDQAFESARAASRMTFMPFVTAGDPDLETTAAVLEALRDAGADLIELGIPYSDPIADGPVIQASYTRALAEGITVTAVFDMLRTLKDRGLPPVLAMVSYAIIFRRGPEAFVRAAAAAGLSGLIVPDLPADEAGEMTELTAEHQLDLVQLIAPTTSESRVQQILSTSRGFVYCISIAGTTGARTELPEELRTQLVELRRRTRLPLAVGFGISRPEQVQMLSGAADGIIVGSAVVSRMSEADSPAAAANAVREFATTMADAAHAVPPTARDAV